jgi:hypothetical protein
METPSQQDASIDDWRAELRKTEGLMWKLGRSLGLSDTEMERERARLMGEPEDPWVAAAEGRAP